MILDNLELLYVFFGISCDFADLGDLQTVCSRLQWLFSASILVLCENTPQTLSNTAANSQQPPIGNRMSLIWCRFVH